MIDALFPLLDDFLVAEKAAAGSFRQEVLVSDCLLIYTKLFILTVYHIRQSLEFILRGLQMRNKVLLLRGHERSSARRKELVRRDL